MTWPPVDVLRAPDAVQVSGEDGTPRPDADVRAVRTGDRLDVSVTSDDPLTTVRLRWNGDLGSALRFLGDAWERSYGELEWRAERPERPLPWSVLATVATPAGERTLGWGVAVRPRAFCWWTADASGLTLWLDVRNGGSPVRLGGRTLDACSVVAVAGEPGERAFAVQRRLCVAMSPAPRLPDHPVHGHNDWYLAYGDNSADLVARCTDLAVACAPEGGVPPYSIVDDGWSRGGLGHGPWLGNDRFGDMGDLAARIAGLGARPGLWYRPLTPLPGQDARWRLPHAGAGMDPTVPEVAAEVAATLRRIAGWGYRLVKHDFTTWDLLGRWGFSMDAARTDPGWSFADRSRTTAEVIGDLYRLIREACGDVLVLGCNTVGHLAAGLVELQRIGDDTSDVSWDRTRRMGVNALAFRAAQHGTFFAVDADIAPLTPNLPWPLAAQWLDLLARSGTPLFVSADPAYVTGPVRAALREALARAASPAATVAEPLDWTTSVTPRRWLADGHEVRYDWTAATIVG